MGAEWTWDRRPVAMTEGHARSLVDAVVDAMTRVSRNDQIEQYKQFARVEAELVATRETLRSRDAEIASLRAHITSLNGFVATMTPGAGQPLFMPQMPAQPHPSATYPVQAPSYPGAPTYNGQPLSTIPVVSPPPSLTVDDIMKNSSTA